MQYGFLNKTYKSVEERDEWEKDVRAFLTTMLDVKTIGRVDGPLESGELNLGLYFPLTPRIHRFFIKNGFKVDHTVGDYVFYAVDAAGNRGRLEFTVKYGLNKGAIVAILLVIVGLAGLYAYLRYISAKVNVR